MQKLAVVAALVLEISLILIKTNGRKSKHKMLSAVYKITKPVLTVILKLISYHIKFVVEVQVNTIMAVQMMLISLLLENNLLDQFQLHWCCLLQSRAPGKD
jgi:hypothetical protein